MPIIYSLVTFRGTTQAESTTPGLTGNFSEVAKLLVKKLPPSNTKLSYIYDAFMFHYIVENQWIYLCICDEKYQRMLAFQFLNEILAFVKNPEATVNMPTSTPSPDAPQPTPLQQFLNKQMVKYNSIVTEKHHKLYSDITALKDTMIENIDKVLDRGERIDLLVDKSENLNEQSFVFKKNSRKIRDEMWWRNTRMILIFSGIGLVRHQARHTIRVESTSTARAVPSLSHCLIPMWWSFVAGVLSSLQPFFSDIPHAFQSIPHHSLSG